MNAILHIAAGPPDTSAGAPPESKLTIASLSAENTALKSRLAVYEAREKQQLAEETLISEKMRAGLRLARVGPVKKTASETAAQVVQASEQPDSPACDKNP